MNTKHTGLFALLFAFLLAAPCFAAPCFAAPCFAAPCFAAETLNLSGTDWRLHEDPKATGEKDQMFNPGVPAGGWIPATVPGNIQADVEATRKLRPFAYG